LTLLAHGIARPSQTTTTSKTMAERLKKFVEPLTEVPALLQRNYKLIRDLDEKVADLQGEMDAKCRALLRGKAGAKRQRTEGDGGAGGLPPEIEAAMQQALGLAEEKVCAFVRAAAATCGARRPHFRRIDPAPPSDLLQQQQL
jgi:hypothetical protein